VAFDPPSPTPLTALKGLSHLVVTVDPYHDAASLVLALVPTSNSQLKPTNESARSGTKQVDPRRPSLLCLLAPVPALALGILVMQASDVPIAVWGQNMAAWTAGTLLCLGMRRPRNSPPLRTWTTLVIVLTLGALATTLLDPGLEGVHRWVKLGPVRLHAAAVVLPLLLVALEALSRAGRWWTSALLAVGVALVLFLQPDAAQVTAFMAAAIILLLPRTRGSVPRLIGLLPLPVLAGLAWRREDPLAAVPHVERIVELAAGLGTGWGVAAVASLLLLPAPFFLAGRSIGGHRGLALGTYVTITLLAPLTGNFPVPVMGYGVSPIIGYLLGLGIFLRTAALREESGRHSPAHGDGAVPLSV